MDKILERVISQGGMISLILAFSFVFLIVIYYFKDPIRIILNNYISKYKFERDSLNRLDSILKNFDKFSDELRDRQKDISKKFEEIKSHDIEYLKDIQDIMRVVQELREFNTKNISDVSLGHNKFELLLGNLAKETTKELEEANRNYIDIKDSISDLKSGSEFKSSKINDIDSKLSKQNEILIQISTKLDYFLKQNVGF